MVLHTVVVERMLMGLDAHPDRFARVQRIITSRMSLYGVLFVLLVAPKRRV